MQYMLQKETKVVKDNKNNATDLMLRCIVLNYGIIPDQNCEDSVRRPVPQVHLIPLVFHEFF